MFLKHRVLNKIILDKDTRFIAKQNIKIVVLTAYYPQTDGQTERLN